MNELDRSSALTCEDVQKGLSLLHTSGAGLTDWALLERHVRQCESCRTREQLELTAIAARRAPGARPPRYWLEKLQNESQLRTTACVEALARLGSLRSTLGPPVGRLAAGLGYTGALAAAGVTDIVGRLGRRSTRAGQQAAGIVMAGAAAAAGLVPRGLDRLTRVASQAPRGFDRLTRGVGSGLSVLSMAGRRAGLATTEAGAAMVPHALAFGSQVRRGLVSAASTLGHAAGVLVGAGRAGVTRGGAAVERSAGLIGVATDHAAVKVSDVSQAAGRQARALVASVRSVVAYAARPPVLTAGTAMVGLVILVAATPLWWPRAWQVERVARLAAPDNASMAPPAGVQVAQAPIDRKSAEPLVPARLIRTARSAPSSEPLGVTDGVARRDQSSARSNSLTRPTASTALSGAGTSREAPRRQEPASTQRIAGEVPEDASAAVDWLLGNTRARRQVENP